MSGLLQRYASGDPAVMEWFAAAPESLTATAPPGRSWDLPLAEALRALQPKLGLAREFRGDEPVIITGQQPGLFLGPMYTLLKAVTAVRLAREMRERHGGACVPVFWVASEDHDFEEVRRAWFRDNAGGIIERVYTPADNSGAAADVAGLPMHKVPADASLHGWIDELAAACAGSELTGETAALLHDTLSEAASVSNWFARLMAALFKDTDMIIFAPHMQTARAAGARVIRGEIESPLETTRLLAEAGEGMRAAGLEPAIVRAEDACNFFLMVGGRRRKVLYRRGRFELPEEEGLSYGQAELLELLAAEPGRFSPNVALRPVVQQVLFPCAAYVAGPGEVAYWAQLKRVFARFSVDMPVVWPRARAVMITPKERRRLNETGLTVDDLMLPERECLDRALDAEAAPPVLEKVARRRAEAGTALEALEGELAGVPGDGAAMVRKMREHLNGGFDRIEARLRRGDEDRLRRATQELERLRGSLAPMRKPQERVFSPFSYLFSQGPGLVARLLDELSLDYTRTQEVEWL